MSGEECISCDWARINSAFIYQFAMSDTSSQTPVVNVDNTSADVSNIASSSIQSPATPFYDFDHTSLDQDFSECHYISDIGYCSDSNTNTRNDGEHDENPRFRHFSSPKTRYLCRTLSIDDETLPSADSLSLEESLDSIIQRRESEKDSTRTISCENSPSIRSLNDSKRCHASIADNNEIVNNKRSRTDADSTASMTPKSYEVYPGLVAIVQPYKDFSLEQYKRKQSKSCTANTLPVPLSLLSGETPEQYIKQCREWISLRPKQHNRLSDHRNLWIAFAKLTNDGLRSMSFSKAKRERRGRGDAKASQTTSVRCSASRKQEQSQEHPLGEHHVVPKNSHRVNSQAISPNIPLGHHVAGGPKYAQQYNASRHLSQSMVAVANDVEAEATLVQFQNQVQRLEALVAQSMSAILALRDENISLQRRVQSLETFQQTQASLNLSRMQSDISLLRDDLDRERRSRRLLGQRVERYHPIGTALTDQHRKSDADASTLECQADTNDY